MTARMPRFTNPTKALGRRENHGGFTLIEFLIAAMTLFVVSSALFRVLIDIQRATGYQSEVQSVLENTQLAMQTIQRYVRQAGNDPRNTGLSGITIISPREMRIQSDLTGSAGPGNPDKGDPDGDVEDSGENLAIRYNSATRSLEIIPSGGATQIVASYISNLNFAFYNAAGNPAATGADVRKIGISISGASLMPDPHTHQVFGMRLDNEVQVQS